MEVHNVPDQGLANAYLIQGVESNPQSIDQFEQFGSMYNEGAPDYVVDQGVYFPTATSYGYVCSGYEPTTDWEDQHKFSPESQDIHYAVTANENMPYVYYSPNYGYAQSPYNPYNPYIPGAVIGADGSIISPTQYYSLPSYENPVTSTAYLPVVFQQMPDAVANGIVDPRIDTAGSAVKVDGLHNLALNTPNSSLIAIGDSSSQRAFAKMSEGGRENIGTGKQHLLTSQIPQIRVPKGVENGVRGKASVVSSQLKAGFTSGNGSSASESGIYAQASGNRVKSNMLSGRGLDDERVDPNTLNDQNKESRMSKSKNHLVVKAYTTRAGNPDVQGNIIITRDQYNRVDFPVEYANAKFFVIKSYSEDDVHKSIKYNVWSSTPNGNKKLNAAYEDAKIISAGDSRGCPIFLLFSVNASGQFCGVAEMTGPVDFHRDMDFWQQDKWSGSFPVKWHIIKDLPNPNFRHIILENNENKPVTNSRDTQEISYKKGLDMLKIFKSYASKTSLLDDFMYYENRQRILQGERTRLYIKSYENPYLVPLLDPPRKFQSVHDFPPICDVNGAKHNVNNLTIVNNSEVFSSAVSTCAMRDHAEPKGKFPLDTDSNNSASDRGSCQVLADGVAEPKGKFPSDTYSNNSASFPGSCPVLADGVSNAVDELKISELNIHSDEQGSGRTVPTSAVSNKANSEMANVVTIGSMPVKVKDSESCGFLTVGTIPLDPRTLLHE